MTFINQKYVYYFYRWLLLQIYTLQDALEIILNGGESAFESSDDEEITELVINEDEVPDHEIDYYFSSSDDEPWTKTATASLHITPKTNIVTQIGRWAHLVM